MRNNGSDENNKVVKPSQDSSKSDKLVPFHLGPEFDPEKHQLHVDQLILALSDHRNSNIALTGTYGSGKSSILQGLAEQLASDKYSHLQIQPIFISLSAFNLDQSSTPEETVNSLQREILKQLLVREDPLKIPKARYRGIPIIPRWRKGVTYALISILLLTIYGLFSDADAIMNWITGDAVAPSGLKLAVVALKIAILFLAVFLVIFALDFSIVNKPAIKAITVGPGKLEIGDSGESYFDKYLAEIVYYFKISEVNLVVFEDLDRFESPAIFESLHQLNQQVNIALATSGKGSASKRTIRFVYAIRDSVFASANEENPRSHAASSQDRRRTSPGENRTKFFDFILPVVPFSTHRNSYEFLYTHLKRAGYGDAIDRELINVIGAHVIDHRLLLNIVYEFAIFRQSILADTSDNKLLAMIAYKNTNLSDFEAIARGQSRLDRLTQEFTNFTRIQRTKSLEREATVLEKQSLNSELDTEETETSHALREYIQKTRGNSIKELRQFLQHQDSDGLIRDARIELDELIEEHLGQNSLGTALVVHGYLDTDFYLYVSAFTEGLNTARAQKFLVYNVGEIHPDPYYDLDKESCEELAKRLAAESFPTLAGAANGNLLLYLAGTDVIDDSQPSDLITRILRDVAREDGVDNLVAELVGSVVIGVDSVEVNDKTHEHAEDILVQCAEVLPDVLSDGLHAQLEETKAVFVLNAILSCPSKNKISISPKFQEAIKDNYTKLPVLSSEEANAQATERAVARIADEMHFLTELKPLNATASFEFMQNGMVDITPENLKLLTESLKVDASLASLAKYPALLGTVADNPGSYVQALEDLDLKSVTAEDIDTMSSKAVPLLCNHLSNTKNNAEDEKSQGDQVTNALTTLFSASSSNARLEDLETTDPRAYRALIRAELVCPSPTNAWTYFNSVGQELDPELKNFLAEIANHKHSPLNEALSSTELLELAKVIMYPTEWEDGEHQRERILKALGEYQEALEWTDLGELTAEKIHTAIQIGIVATDIVSFQSLCQAVPKSNRDELLTVFLAEAPIEPDTFDASHFSTLDRFGFLIKNTKINTDLRAKLVGWLCDDVLSAELDDEEVQAILEFSNRTEKSLSSEFVLELVYAYSSSKTDIGFHEMITESVLLLAPDSLDEEFFKDLFTGLGGNFERLLEKFGGSLKFEDFPGLWDLLDLAKEHLRIISSFKQLENQKYIRVSRRSKR